MSKTVVLVTNTPKIGELFKRPDFRDFTLLKVFYEKDDVLPYLETSQPDILLVTDAVASNTGITTQQMLLRIHEEFPDIRIVFFPGDIEDKKNVQKLAVLGALVTSSIYNIFPGGTMSSLKILEALNVEKTLDDVRQYREYYQNENPVDAFKGYRNVIVCTSVKPGTGKSTLAVNLAVAIAKYGQMKRNGRPPRVAIVEGDLTSLSVGTLLRVENPQYNLKEALHQISKVIDDTGCLSGTDEQLEEVKSYVRRCFVKYGPVPNLYAMVSSNISLTDLNEINPYQYYYLIQCIVGAFDVVVVDANSSLEHQSTGPLFDLASRCYFVVNMDYNDIQNNIRYRDELVGLGISKKIRYIMNKYVSPENQSEYLEDLGYDMSILENPNIHIDKMIPMIDSTVMLNRGFKGKPIVLDNSEDLIDAKQAFLDIANENWKIDYSKVNQDAASENEKEKQKKQKPASILGSIAKTPAKQEKPTAAAAPAEKKPGAMYNLVDGIVNKLNSK
jgi:MinD-like ATPase involved in chromosome partitioning or flagellar assembly